MNKLPKTEFTRNFTRLNGFEKEFTAWHFEEGMLFNNSTKWWGDKGQRKALHEGIDLFSFNDQHEKIKFFNSETLIPPLMEGTIVSIFPDFIGKSILFCHPIIEEGCQLCSMFGHTTPLPGLTPGDTVDFVDRAVARISQEEKDHEVPGHLHISLFWSATDFPLETIDWSSLHSLSKITLVDPIEII